MKSGCLTDIQLPFIIYIAIASLSVDSNIIHNSLSCLQEAQKRQVLERKVTRLEEENEKLTELRSKAATQLQVFSEKFFAMPEPKILSPVTTPHPSPRNSYVELRRVGSNSSVTSRRSTSSLKSIKSRYSNISL